MLRAAAAGWARARAGRHLRGAWSGLRGRRCHGVNAAAPANASHFRWHGAPSTAWCLTRELSRRGKRSHSHGGSTKGPSDHYHRTARARSQREAQADCQLNRQELSRRTVCLVSVRVRASVRACSCARPRPSSMGAKRRADRTRSETSLPRACCPYADRRCVHQARPLPRQVKRRACALARQARACAAQLRSAWRRPRLGRAHSRSAQPGVGRKGPWSPSVATQALQGRCSPREARPRQQHSHSVAATPILHLTLDP